MNRFEYIDAHTPGEVCALLERHGPDARLLAGGTDILIRWRQGSWAPKTLINIKSIPQIDGVAYDSQSGLRLGALTRIRALELDPHIRSRYSAMTGAAASFAGIQIRNLATVGGNVCNASPAGDTLPALLVFDGEANVANAEGQRWLSLDGFFVGPGRAALGPGELVTEFRFPPVPENTGSVYIKHSPRQAMDIAAVGVAARVSLDSTTGACKTARIALGAVGPIPLRARTAEAALEGQHPRPPLIAEAARLAAEEARPMSDIRDSAAHRKAMVEVLVERALLRAAQVAERGTPESFESIRALALEGVAVT